MSQHHLLPSNKPGHHWSLTVFRRGSALIATAQEGRAGRSEAIGCTTFEFEMFGDRREQIHAGSASRLTAKAERECLAVMHAHLRDKGLLEGATPPAAPEPLAEDRQAVFRLVAHDGYEPDHYSLDEFVAAMAARGYARQGVTNPCGVLRDELKVRPIFKGLVGPMWGGTNSRGLPIVRYETNEANAQLSA